MTLFWDKVIMAGYAGIVILIVALVRYHSNPRQKQEYSSAAEREALIRNVEILRYSGAFMIVVGAPVFAGILYLAGDLPGRYVLLLALVAGYMIIGYIHMSIKEKITKSPPLEITSHEEIRFLTKTFKKVLDVNAVTLLAFCVFYTWMKSVPLGIWGMLVWALVLIVTYPAVVVTDLLWTRYPLDSLWLINMRIQKRKSVAHVVLIVMSWVLALLWLEFGL